MDVFLYHEEFRASLFTSGITVASFLISMKSFILKTMKDVYYDSAAYKRDFFEKLALGEKRDYYGPLKRFSLLFSGAILLSFISAISQITIGLFGTSVVVWMCLVLAASSWVLVGVVIFLVGRNWLVALNNAESNIEKP